MDFEDLFLSVEDFLRTLDEEKGYWDGVYCSDQDMGGRFLKEFLDWMQKRQ